MTSARSLPAFIEPQALMGIRSLELRARTVVEGLWNGLHRSPFHGFSVEFSEYRQYSPGDDPRFLDWRVFARSDRFFIRKFEDETNLRCHLLVDQSRSMDYRSGGVSKSAYAATLAATLGYFLHLQGDAVGLLTFDEQVRDFLPARHRPGHLRQLMFALERPVGGRGTDVVAALDRILGLVRKRGLVVLISDLLSPLDRLERALVSLHASGHEVCIFQVLDPAEFNLGMERASVVEDVESGQRLYVDPAIARAGYREAFDAHQAAVRGICDKLGMACQVAATNEPLEGALLGFLQTRERRGPLGRARGCAAR